jgi:DNA helicase-2/ATP-dependent DNA helicase PcrA
MYRVNAQSRALEEACLRQGIKYRLVGGIRFYQRKEVKDLMAYLHLLYNPQDEINLRRVVSVPPRGIGARTMQQLVEWSQRNNLPLFAAMQNIAAARQAGQPSPVNLGSRAINSIARFADNMTRLIELASQIPIVDLIDRTMEDSGLRNHIQNSDDHPDERWENIMEFRETAREFDTQDPPDGLASLLERASLVSQVDSYEDSDESITLITLHQAKGLEFPVVFIVGLEEGLLPHSRSMDSEEELEEERRLCYVGFTRAEERLYLLRAFRRGLWGSSGPTLASRFLREVPPELVASPRPANTERKARTALSSLETWKAAAAPAPSRTTLKVGDSVRHLVFGEGVVTGFTPTGDDHEVTVQFAEGVGLKRLLASFAPLENLEG